MLMNIQTQFYMCVGGGRMSKYSQKWTLEKSGEEAAGMLWTAAAADL
jgi:hypothetical protein